MAPSSKSPRRSTVSNIGIFWHVLWSWKGSVYRLLYKDLLIYIAIYYAIVLTFKFCPEESKVYFYDIIKYCEGYSKFFPLSFVLGFFVSTIMTRWWNQYTSIPWSTACAFLLSCNLHGSDDIGRVLRRTVIRYVNCSITILFRNLSTQVQKRFPELEDLVKADILKENELAIIKELTEKHAKISVWTLPLIWAANICTKAREIGRIPSDTALKTIIDELNRIRGLGGTLGLYSSLNISNIYSHVVTIACYSYFTAALFGSQTIGHYKKVEFNYFPIFLVLQFLFYMGWLKVAEELLDPLGEDEEDFDLVSIIDTNVRMGFIIVDQMHERYPILEKDVNWEKEVVEVIESVDSTKDDEQSKHNSKENLELKNVDVDGEQDAKGKLSYLPTNGKPRSPVSSLLIDPELLPKEETEPQQYLNATQTSSKGNLSQSIEHETIEPVMFPIPQIEITTAVPLLIDPELLPKQEEKSDDDDTEK